MLNVKTAMIAAATACCMAVPANAVTTFELVGTVIGGAFDGTVGTGTVTYDETLLDGSGNGFFTTLDDPEFSVEFTIFGQTFTESDDIDFPDLPSLTISDFMPVTLDYIVSEFVFDPLQTATDIMERGVFGFSTLELFDDTPGVYTTEVFVDEQGPTPVPLPAGGLLLLSALGGVMVARRKKS